jgi:xanthine/CO dehydrogenase XdhC/CoxF family maturation factor
MARVVVNPLQAVVEEYQRLGAGARLALVTVVGARGSVCRRPGARMLLGADGRLAGSIGAGCMERDVIERARGAMHGREPLVLRYDSDPDTDIVWGLGLGCGGVTELLVEPLDPGQECRTLAFIGECLGGSRAGALATVFETRGDVAARIGAGVCCGPDGTVATSVQDAALARALAADAREALARGRPAAAREYEVAGGSVRALVEVVRPPIALLIFGADQDAVPVARLARGLGWRVTVVDSRAGLASAARFPGASILVCPPDRAVERVRLDERTAALIMMHQWVWDLELLRTVLPSPAPYVGVLGPRQRTEGLLRHLGSTAAAQAKEKLHAPVGLDIGAETAEEIAIAVVGEIQAVFAGRAGGLLRDRRGQLHPRPEPQDD